MLIVASQQFTFLTVGTFRVELQKASVAHQIVIEHPNLTGMALGTDDSHFSFSFHVCFFSFRHPMMVVEIQIRFFAVVAGIHGTLRCSCFTFSLWAAITLSPIHGAARWKSIQ